MSGMDNAIFEVEFRYRLQSGGFTVRSRNYDALKAFRQHVQFATRAEECGFTVKPASEFDIESISIGLMAQSHNYDGMICRNCKQEYKDTLGTWCMVPGHPVVRIWPRKTPEKASPETTLPSFLISGSPRQLP